MSSDHATEAVRSFLAANGDRAFLVSEIVAAVRSFADNEAEVLDAIENLTEKGEAVSRLFAVNDPHLAFSGLRFVAAIRPDGKSREAEVNIERAYQSWLREWLGSHRCS